MRLISSTETARKSRIAALSAKAACLFWAAIAVVGCTTDGRSGNDRPETQNLTKVITTVAPITNIVENVAGQRAAVVGIIPEGRDSHTYEPPPEVARELASADVIFVNGLNLETSIIKLAAEVKRPETPLVSLGNQAITPDAWVFDFSFPREGGDPNPHLWMNPVLAGRYATIVAEELARVAPGDAEYFRSRAEEFVASRIAPLDEAIIRATESIPKNKRKLLTYHDSFAYFAPRYGYTVVGAVQPADFSEPSAAEVARLVDQIRSEGISAVFGSEVYPSPVLETIARETGAKYVTDLRDDTLPGSPGDPDHTYVGMMVENVRIMVSALGGDPSPLDAVPVTNLADTSVG